MKLPDLIPFFELYRNLKEAGNDTILHDELLEKEKDFINQEIIVPGVVNEIDFHKKEIIITYKDKSTENGLLKRLISKHFFVFAFSDDLDALIKKSDIEKNDLVRLTGVITSLHRQSVLRISLSSISLIEKDHGLNKTTAKKGCFIATAVYGSHDAAQVQQFYEYRDMVLAKSFFGRLFIRFYYCVSPSLAKWIDDKPLLKSFVRKHVLDKLLQRFRGL